MLSIPYRHLLNRAPSINRVINPRFFYCLCVNTLLYAISLWLLTGGGQYEFLGSSSFGRIFEILLSSTLFLFCVFYFLALIPFGIYGEWIVCIMYFFIGMADIFLSLTFHTQLNNVFFLIFLSTNTAEATEFLQFYGTRFELICALIGFIGLSAFFFTLSSRPTSPRNRIHHARSIQIAGIIMFISLCVIGIKLYKLSQSETPIQLYLREKSAPIRWYDAIESSLVERSAFIKEYHDLSKRLDENLATRQNLSTKEILSNAQNLPLLVLVIGESTQRNYLSLYGYPLPTTPNLESLRKKGNLIVFEDFISSFASTDKALQKALTFSNYENSQTPWWEQQNLIDVLNLAGYKTHWLSNQDMISIYGNSPEIIAKRANFTRFSAMTDGRRSSRATDGVLLPILDQVRADSQNTSQPMFYAIHLMGAHLAYGERFPKSFARFSSQDLQESGLDSFPNAQKLTKSQLRAKANYLNAIFYGDWVLSEICKRFENEDVLVLYLSDHGDEVYDWRDFAGHTNDARFSFEVPAFAYVSDTFKRNHPEILKRLKSAENRPFMTDDLIHAVLDLLGIKNVDFKSSRSVFSPDYNTLRKRIINENQDYDATLKIISYQ